MGWPLGLVLLAGCAASVRAEVGYGTEGWRAGLGLAIGVTTNDDAPRAVTLSGGVRQAGTVSATSRAAMIAKLGPLWAEGAFEIDQEGAALAPSLLVPVWTRKTDRQGSSIFPGSGAHTRTDTEHEVLGIGLQPRVGRTAGDWVAGVDLVVELLSITTSFDP
jgi:hypothetical protein